MTAPYSEIFDLGKIGDTEVVRTLRPTPAENAGIAEWLGAIAVETLQAEIMLSRTGTNLYCYEARFAADVVQACVVTLEPVHARLEGAFHRVYRVAEVPRRRNARHDVPSATMVTISDEDDPEMIDTSLLDLAAPVLEELTLVLDPYPKAPGVAFELPKEPEEPALKPFAALEQLKAKLAAEDGKPAEDASSDEKPRSKPKGR